MKATGGFLLQLTSCAFALSGPWWWWFSMSWLVWLWKPSWTLQAEMTDAIFPAETQPLGLVTFGWLLMLSCYALGVWSMFSLARVPLVRKPGNSSGLKGGGTTQHISICNQKTHTHKGERYLKDIKAGREICATAILEIWSQPMWAWCLLPRWICLTIQSKSNKLHPWRNAAATTEATHTEISMASERQEAWTVAWCMRSVYPEFTLQFPRMCREWRLADLRASVSNVLAFSQRLERHLWFGLTVATSHRVFAKAILGHKFNKFCVWSVAQTRHSRRSQHGKQTAARCWRDVGWVVDTSHCLSHRNPFY